MVQGLRVRGQGVGSWVGCTVERLGIVIGVGFRLV